MSDVDELKEENKNSNKEFMESVKNFATFFTAVSVIAIGIYKIITYYFNFNYALEAEKFYGVPKEYFFENMMNDNFITLFLVIVLFIMIISPFLIKTINNKKRLGILESVGYSLILVLVTFFISLIFCDQILINKYGIKGYDNYMVIGSTILSIITFLLYMYTLVTDFSDKSRKKKKSIKERFKCIRNNIKNKKNSIKNVNFKKENIFVFLWTILIVIYSIFIFSLASIKIYISPENKVNYEVIKIKYIDNFVSDEDERNDGKEKVKVERAVILSEKNGLFLVMNIDEQEYSKNILKLNKNYYKLVSPNDYEIEHMTFDKRIE